MFMSLISFITGLILPAMIVLLAIIISQRSYQDREKLSPFECGFDPQLNARIPFSLRFFLLAVIFLVFDIEIVLLMPIPLLYLGGMLFQVIFGGIIFLVILMIGLIHEWREGSLDWSK